MLAELPRTISRRCLDETHRVALILSVPHLRTWMHRANLAFFFDYALPSMENRIIVADKRNLSNAHQTSDASLPSLALWVCRNGSRLASERAVG